MVFGFGGLLGSVDPRLDLAAIRKLRLKQTYREIEKAQGWRVVRADGMQSAPKTLTPNLSPGNPSHIHERKYSAMSFSRCSVGNVKDFLQ